jgi:uncharacterized coiled-coil protein SlyX
MVITQCEQVNGQQWTDGYELYSDDGTYYQSQREDTQDLVAFVGPLPVSRPAETDIATAVAGGVSDDPGRIIYDLEERLEAANATIIGQTAEIDRLNRVLGDQACVIDSLKESNARLVNEALQAQKYVSEANEKSNQQTRTIEHLSDKVRSLERFNDDKESDLDHLRQLRRTNDAIIKELRTLLTYALSKK